MLNAKTMMLVLVTASLVTGFYLLGSTVETLSENAANHSAGFAGSSYTITMDAQNLDN